MNVTINNGIENKNLITQNQLNNEINITPYDNDVTLLYKWLKVFQLPINLIIIRPRTASDIGLPGTERFVFESIINMVERLYDKGESAVEIFDIIKTYKKNITIDDIAIAHYILYMNRIGNLQARRGGADFINQIYYKLDNNRTTDAYSSDDELWNYYSEEWLPNTDMIEKGLDENVINIIERLIETGHSPIDIYNHINLNINIDDMAMLYYIIYMKQNSIIGSAKFVNDIYFELDNTRKSDPYPDDITLAEYYNKNWVPNTNELTYKNLQRLDVIEKIQETLSQIDKEDKIQFSPVTVNSAVVSFSPKIDSRLVTIDDGLEIFNNSVVSKFVPFIRYNNNIGESYTKVYTGDKIENEPNYDITILPYDKSNDKNTIYLNLWLADMKCDNRMDLHDAPSESFFTVSYYLETNFLEVKIPVGADIKKRLLKDETLAVTRTQDSLPNLVFGESKEIKVGGDFNMWSFDYEESSLLDMILHDPLMNVYLYAEENIKPFALKKRLDLHYRSIFVDEAEGTTETENAYISNYAAVSITLNQKIAEIDTVVDIYDPMSKNTTQSMLMAGQPFVHVNITRALSQTVVRDFIPIFNLLMKYYSNNKQEIIQDYYDVFPELAYLPQLLLERKTLPETIDQNILNINRKAVTNKRVNAKIRRLQEEAPDLFVQGYPRRCQCPLQPIIVSNEEAQLWRETLIEGGTRQRQVMSFPHPNSKWNFVCPNDKAPYPTVKVNYDLPNKDIYPYIPCCAMTDKMSPNKKSRYNDYIQGKPIIHKVGAKAEKKISTPKILSPDKIAYLPRAVNSIIRKYSDDAVDMVRYGVIYSPNSLLHCISVAIDDPTYYAQPSDEEKELYVSRVRAYISRMVDPGLMRQELYDYSDNEIKALLTDNNIFLDPSLVYRAIEDIYNINIYVFSPPHDKDDDQLGNMDIPRFKIFHARPLRLNRPTIVLIKSWGSESDNLDYPQCELIVDYDEDNLQIVKMYGPAMTDICHSTLESTLRTMTWKVTPSNEFKVNANIYYYIDHLSLFQVPAVSQFIDNNGKMRAITIDLGKNNLLTIATIPSQPENLPVSNDIYRIPYELAVSIFGRPTGITKDTDNNITGLWYQIMDIRHGEYVYVIPDKPKETLQYLETIEQGPLDPLLVKGENVTSRLIRLRKSLNIITQLVKWLYELFKLKYPADPNVFASNYMVQFVGDVPDSSKFYDISKIERRLPLVTTIEDAIASLHQKAPTLFTENSIIMYSEAFSDRILRMLKDYHNLNYGIDAAPKTFIDNYYETESDFKETPNAKIFISEKDLGAWLTSLKSSQNYSRYFNIRKKIDISMAFSNDPYLYQDTDGKIYIIQNIVGGSKGKALAVAATWFDDDYKVNIGSDPLQALEFTPPHMIYGISSSSVLVPIDDQTAGYDTLVKLLYYGTQTEKAFGKESRYAAMLEIL